MKRREWSILYLTILTIVIAGLSTFEAPASTLVYAALALACPPMMIFVPGGRVAATKGIAAPKATARTSMPAGGGLARRSS